jgi:ubiquinone/menaquinone biosynthesis C-methylase UbiE
VTEGYESDTRAAYQDSARAASYRDQTRRLTWARVATARELRLVAKMIEDCGGADPGRILDAPCGTGVAGPLLARLGQRATALDVSSEMMSLARAEYPEGSLNGFVRGDMTALPFLDRSFTGAIVLGFMHRLPVDVGELSIQELTRVVDRYLVLTFSVDTQFQRLKKMVLRLLRGPAYIAPAPRALREIRSSLEAAGLAVRQCESVLPGLSSAVVVLAERCPPPDADVS